MPAVTLEPPSSLTPTYPPGPTAAATSTPGRGDDECIGSFEYFAYHVFDYGDKSIPKNIRPLSPWEVALEFPDTALYTVLGARQIAGRTEIWVSRFDYDDDTREKENNIIIYNPDSGLQTKIPAFIGDTGLWVEDIFFIEDGSVWGRNNWSSYANHSLTSFPILSKYNPENRKFEFDPNVFEVRLTNNQKNQTNPEIIDRPDIFLNKDGIFWFFVNRDGLYSYDPSTAKTTKHLAIPKEEIYNPILAPDGNIYYQYAKTLEQAFAAFETKIVNQDIFQFSPKTETLTVYTTIREVWPLGGTMWMDQAGRLWFGALGWLNPDGVWQIIHPDIEAYNEHKLDWFSYTRWQTPFIKTESSNGLLWFYKLREADDGIAWYDPKTGKGCWFTTNIGRVIEGPGGIMWHAGNGKLYKYDL